MSTRPPFFRSLFLPGFDLVLADRLVLGLTFVTLSVGALMVILVSLPILDGELGILVRLGAAMALLGFMLLSSLTTWFLERNRLADPADIQRVFNQYLSARVNRQDASLAARELVRMAPKKAGAWDCLALAATKKSEGLKAKERAQWLRDRLR